MDPNTTINSMTSLFSLIQLLVGLYCFYAWFQLRSNTIPEKFFLLNKELPRDKCIDQEYYCMYMRPRILIFALVITVFGSFSILDAELGLLLAWCPAGSYNIISLLVNSIIPFGVIVWFVLCMLKIQKELW